MQEKFSHSEFGYEATVGKFAGQADGSAWIQHGGTVVFVTVVSAPSQEFPGFLPLTVDYREQFAAAGRIPGGYFKREGRPTEKEILTCRIIDRAIRPLFAVDYFNKVQVVATVYSVDKDHSPAPLALVATSLALALSKIPFLGPIGICEAARINGVWVYNPTHPQTVEADANITVAGNEEGVNMVEGSMNELDEAQCVDVIFEAHAYIKKQIAWQKEIAAQVGNEKETIEDTFDWNVWMEYAQKFLTDERVRPLFGTGKEERKKLRSELEEEFAQSVEEGRASKDIPSNFISYVFDKALTDAITEMTFVLEKRLDNRDFTTVRSISTEVGLLPFNHGSSLFQRGRTQVLTSVTLGGGQDEMRTESLMGETDKSFMLHYNFLPFSVGEARPMRGPGRREIGHGALAASSLKAVLPSREEFGYTLRIVADVLESDGSTSMATVCGSTMALMNAGVPIRKMVSGIAMGLLMNKGGDIRILTDIAGIEDAFGLMDFKVAGTDEGVTALQMDIKYKGGFPRDIFVDALSRAKEGRSYIMNEMRTVMEAPRSELSDLVPKIISFKIPRDKIGAVIGSGGKVIREIIELTDTTIDIDDNGLVKIFGHPGAKLDQAISWVKILGGAINVGDQYKGHVKRLAEFGVFVEIAPGQVGLVHISTVSRDKQDAFMKKYKEGDQVMVEVLDYDSATGRIRLRIIEESENNV